MAKILIDMCQRWLLRRRRLTLLVVIICLIFLIYQLLSLKRLNVQISEQLSQSVAKHTIDNEPKQESNVNQIEDNSSVNSNTDEKSETHFDNNSETLKTFGIIGVLPKFAKFYRKTSDSFKCLTSGESISYQYINDDYCDCTDGTDEPSTNACPHNRFYCRTNSGKSDDSNDYISSAKVNDGICDCCDGSDEYKDISTPLKLSRSQIETIKSSRRIVPTPPCPNVCHIF